VEADHHNGGILAPAAPGCRQPQECRWPGAQAAPTDSAPTCRREVRRTARRWGSSSTTCNRGPCHSEGNSDDSDEMSLAAG
jgi:hypothetical protein